MQWSIRGVMIVVWKKVELNHLMRAGFIQGCDILQTLNQCYGCVEKLQVVFFSEYPYDYCFP